MESMAITITKDTFESIASLLDAEPYYTYSGRGMIGKQCPAFDTSKGLIEVGVAIALSLEYDDDAWDIARDVRTDNMGYDTVVYFPNLEVT